LSDIDVSVVIPSFNGRHLLERCLPAVESSARAFGRDRVEIIVVDDSSTDGTGNWLACLWPDVRLVELRHNHGFAAAANAGAAESRGDWVAILNNDTVVRKDWISAASKCFAQVRVGAVASQVLDHETGLIESAGDGYSTAGLAFQGGNGQSPISDARPSRAFSACAAAAFYRKTALCEVGFFDPDLGEYYEDVDLGFRLNLNGWQTVLAPESVCYHLGGRSYGGRSWRMLFSSAVNSERVFFACTPWPLLLKMLPAHLAAVFAQGVLRAFRREFLPFAAGKIAFIADLPAVMDRRRRVQASARAKVTELSSVLESRWVHRHILARFRAFPFQTRSAGALKFRAAATL
jgi:GT2 family glycosyltransferase